MKVLHALSAIASGGVETQLLEVIRALGPPTFEHRVICTAANGYVADELASLGVPIDELGDVTSVLRPKRYLQARTIAKAWRPDLIHGAVMEGVVLASVVGASLRIPTLLEETSDPQDRRPLGNLLVRIAAMPSEGFLAISPAVGRYLVDTARVPAKKVHVIPYGSRVPSPPTRAKARSCFGLPEEAVVVGTVCRLFDDHKRVSDVIRAVGELMPSRPQLHYLIVGEGPDEAMLRDLAAASPHPERIHFAGKVQPSDPAYAAMDIFCLASSREGFGLVATEAMHTGLPVVASQVGGLAEILDDGVTGLLVPPLAPQQLAAALARLVDDRHLRDAMGEAGSKRARERYALDRYVADIRQLFEDIAWRT